jgi:hypothetical protein
MVKALTISTIEQAATQVLGCGPNDLTEAKYDYYGLKIFSANGIEFAIGTDEEATEAVKQYVYENAWTFNASFIIDHSKVSYSKEIEKSLKDMQGKLCESANELVKALIEDMDAFVEDAISSDGRGMFLSPYDSNEQEVKVGHEYFYAYRLN